MRDKIKEKELKIKEKYILEVIRRKSIELEILFYMRGFCLLHIIHNTQQFAYANMINEFINISNEHDITFLSFCLITKFLLLNKMKMI